jgi:hypothetical protein
MLKEVTTMNAHDSAVDPLDDLVRDALGREMSPADEGRMQTHLDELRGRLAGSRGRAVHAPLWQRLMGYMRGEGRIRRFRSMSWKRKLAWACVLAVVVGGVAWGATELRVFSFHGKAMQLTLQTKKGPETVFITTGNGMAVGKDRADAQARLKAVQDAFAAGKYKLVKTVPSFPLPIGIYEVTLPDGSTMETGGPIPAFQTDAEVAAQAQEMEDQAEQGQGELVAIYDLKKSGIRYDYRYRLSDGYRHTSSHAPYLGNEKAAHKEVEQLMAEGRGEFQWGPPKTPGDMYCYRVTLNNGKPMMYYTDKPAN